MNEIASEQGHWYRRDGSPCYTVLSKKGTERPATLADARKLGLVPSVTTIIRQLDRPGLNYWFTEQIVMAALTLPKQNGESESDYARRVRIDSQDESKKAAKRGTLLHGDVERAILGQPHGHDSQIKNLEEEMRSLGLDLYGGSTEHTFAHPLGFGGKIDWWRDHVIADIKSKDTFPRKKNGEIECLWYREHLYQLAGYALGKQIEEPRCLSIFVSVQEGQVITHEWTRDDIARGKRQFLRLLEFWQDDNQFSYAG